MCHIIPVQSRIMRELDGDTIADKLYVMREQFLKKINWWGVKARLSGRISAQCSEILRKSSSWESYKNNWKVKILQFLNKKIIKTLHPKNCHCIYHD